MPAAASTTCHRPATTLDHAGIGIAEIDAKDTLLRVNAHLCRLTGYSPKNCWAAPSSPGATPRMFDSTASSFAASRPARSTSTASEKRIRRKDGGYFWAAVASSSARTPTERFLNAVRVQHDITRRAGRRNCWPGRIEEQAGLHHCSPSDRQHARLLHDLMPLDAIVRASGCQRAAILLLDESARCGSSPGAGCPRPSAGGRRAFAMAPEDRDPRPICLDDVAFSDLSASLRQAVAAEGIAALAFVPIQGGGRLLGKFMAYYDPAARLLVDGDRAGRRRRPAGRLRHPANLC